jgi:hypothetical protein
VEKGKKIARAITLMPVFILVLFGIIEALALDRASDLLD